MKTIIYNGSDIVAGEFISNFPPGDLNPAIRSRALRMVPDSPTTPVSSDARLYRVPEYADEDLKNLLQAGGWGDGLYVEPNYVVRGQQTTASRESTSNLLQPSPPRLEWWIRNDGQVIDGVPGTNGADIRALDAWAITKGSPDVAVALLDSGMDVSHPELVGNIWAAPQRFEIRLRDNPPIDCAKGTRGINCLELDSASRFDVGDDHGHGTRLAGIVGGIHNGRYSTGVSSSVTLIPIKVLDSQLYGTIHSVVNGLECALQIAERGLPTTTRLMVILASWGFRATEPSTPLVKALERLRDRGMLVVCAAQNSLPDHDGNLDKHHYYLPVFAHANLLSVTASDHRDRLIAGYGRESIDISAPGYAINSPTPRGGCSEASGASMAAAFAAGVAALVQSRDPTIAAGKLRRCLIEGAKKVEWVAASQSMKSVMGLRLDALGALQAASGNSQQIIPSVPTKDAYVQQPTNQALAPTGWEVEQTADEYQDAPRPRQKDVQRGDIVTLERNTDDTYRCVFRERRTQSETFKSCSELVFRLNEKGKWKPEDFTTAEKSTVEYPSLAETVRNSDYSYFEAEGSLRLKDGSPDGSPCRVRALFVPIRIPQGTDYLRYFALILVNPDEWPLAEKPLGMQGGMIHGPGNG